MPSTRPSVFARDDTIFGVCEALAEDFGFRPLFLRALFALGLFWNPLAALAAYGGFGALVALSRWLVPDPAEAPAAVETAANEDALSDEAQAREELAEAA